MALKDARGVVALFLAMAREEFDTMDHKFLRIAGGLVSFLIAGIVWMVLFRGV